MRISDWSSDVCSSDLAYTLRPSDARALAAANLVLWIGPSLETFLDEPLATLAQPGAAVELLDSEGLTLHDSRSRSEERRVGKECVSRVDLGGRRITQNKCATHEHCRDPRQTNGKTDGV